VLFDQQHSDALVSRFSDGGQQALHGEGSQAQRQLVSHQQFGATRQCSSQRQHLLLAARKQAGRVQRCDHKCS
jgi:hypothetical protein